MAEYLFKFLLGGIIITLATYFSKSKNYFLSGIITLLPIMTLLNMRLQLTYMNVKEFRMTQLNAILGALGAVMLLLSIYVLTLWFKPFLAIALSLLIYIAYMIICRQFV